MAELQGDLDKFEKDYFVQNAVDDIWIEREWILQFLRLERTILLGGWDDFSQLIQSLGECKDLNLNRYLADVVLSSKMPPDMAMGCMRVRS